MSPEGLAGAARLAEFACNLQIEQVPAEVLEVAKLRLLDTLGCGLAASALSVATEARSLADELGEGTCTLIGSERGASAATAALANAMLCHGLDFDDTHPGAVAHITTVSGPAATAAAEAAGVDGATLLAALVSGAEVSARIGLAATGEFHERGFHATAVCGVFGASAACARVQRLDSEQTASALGIAGSMASGIFAYLADGTPTKPIHAGWAAHAGVIAAGLARHGASGPPSVLDSHLSIYQTFLGHQASALSAQLQTLGQRWETGQIALKRYPACHYAHGTLHAAELALADRRVAIDQIEAVRVFVPDAAVSIVLEPSAAKVRPRTPYEAKFSLQYSLAALLAHGELALADYTEEAIADPAVLALAAKIRYATRDYDSYPGAFPGAVEIRLASGETLQAEEPIQIGDARNPLPAGAVIEKFRANAGLALEPEGVERLELGVLDLERQSDLVKTLAPLREAAGQRAAIR